MGRLDSLNLFDEIVRVNCVASCDGYFNIHEGMLKKHAPSLDIQKDDEEDIRFVVIEECSNETFAIFSNWLYKNEMPQNKQDHLVVQVRQLLGAHALGRQAGCVDFMDAMLDEIIKRLTRSSKPSCNGDMINDFIEEFPANSGGWNFMIDYVVYMGCRDEDTKSSWHGELGEVADEEFVIELAQEFCKINRYQVPRDVAEVEFSRILVSGFLSKNGPEDSEDEANYPWRIDKCQYHHHLEHGLPCYKTKR